MKSFLIILLAVLAAVPAGAYKYNYTFDSTPVADALLRICREHPDLNISFIYKELDTYKTSARVRTDSPLDALRQTVGLNPVSVVADDDAFYVEALQHGRFRFQGRVVGEDEEPLAGATVMLLSPKDSAVATYGIADGSGRFVVPCDRRDVVAKIMALGYRTSVQRPSNLDMGTIRLAAQPFVLDTANVTARDAYALSDRSVFVPSSRQKDASADAIGLLQRMAIPQLDVNPVSKNVRTTTGDDVAIFIDYLPAAAADLQGMLTKDVKRVEYYTYPSDARFGGAHFVVNFIMQKYEWGGYTRLAGEQWLGVEYSEAALYSKMVYKKMTFDVATNGHISAGNHGGSELTEHFRLPHYEGSTAGEITRRSSPDDYHRRANGSNVTARAIYAAEHTQLSNSLSLAISNSPRQNESSNMTYADALLPPAITRRNTSSHDYALTYTGNFYHRWSDAVSLNTSASYQYGRNAANSCYWYEVGREPIVNDALEHSHEVHITPNAEWKLNANHSVSLSMQFGWERHRILYSGSSPSRQAYTSLVAVPSLSYRVRWRRWRAGAYLSWAWNNTDITGYKARSSFPLFDLSASWTPGSKHQLDASLGTGRVVPGAFSKSPNMLQQDALIWYAGTPELRDFSRFMARFSYVCMPSQRWQIGASAVYRRSSDRVAAVYRPDGPGGTLLRQYMNTGNYSTANFSVNATARFLNGRLSVQLRPLLLLSHSSGAYDMSVNVLKCMGNVAYYFGKFSVSAFYMTPEKMINETAGSISRTPSTYILSVGWSHAQWMIGLSAYNFLRRSWEMERTSLRSTYYDSDFISYGTGAHQRFSLYMSWTISYGKKVSTRNEVSGSGTAGSAILK